MNQLSELDFTEISEAVLPIVECASAAVLQVYARGEQGNEHVGLQTKRDDSPVTEADLTANRILTDGLRELSADIPVVSEEKESSHAMRQPTGRFWLLDPVDGTREFLARTDEFTVNVALIDESIAVFGMVQAPALGQVYWGAPGLGAWRKDDSGTTPVSVAPYPQRDSAGHFDPALRIIASRSHMNTATRAHIEQMQPHTLLRVGSSLKFCRIAEGEADYYPRLGPTNEWDTAAAQAVVEAAGGQVLTLNGARLTYGKDQVLNPYFQVTSWSEKDVTGT